MTRRREVGTYKQKTCFVCFIKKRKRKTREKSSESYGFSFSLIFNNFPWSWYQKFSSLPGLKLTEPRRATRRRFATVDCFANHGWFLRASNSCTLISWNQLFEDIKWYQMISILGFCWEKRALDVGDCRSWIWLWYSHIKYICHMWIYLLDFIGMPGAWYSKVIGICVDSCWQGTDQLNPEALHREFQTRSEPKQPHQSHQSFGEKRHTWKRHRLPFQVVELHKQDDLQSRKTNITDCSKTFKNAFPLSSH